MSFCLKLVLHVTQHLEEACWPNDRMGGPNEGRICCFVDSILFVSIVRSFLLFESWLRFSLICSSRDTTSDRSSRLTDDTSSSSYTSRYSRDTTSSDRTSRYSARGDSSSSASSYTSKYSRASRDSDASSSSSSYTSRYSRNDDDTTSSRYSRSSTRDTDTSSSDRTSRLDEIRAKRGGSKDRDKTKKERYLYSHLSCLTVAPRS